MLSIPLLVLAFTPSLPAGEPELALAGLDPVELAQGREVPGAEERTRDLFVYRYRFASERSLQEFERDPERYAIQMGGGCGRMGPLSGRGSPDRFLVHAGRIYVFASDACRDAFAKAPERFLDPDDPVPTGTEAERARALSLLDRAEAALGGRERIAAVRTLAQERRRTSETKDGPRVDTVSTVARFSDGLRVAHTYGEWKHAQVLAGAAAFEIGNDGAVEDLHASGRRELERELLRSPVAILRARARPDWVAFARGPGEVAGRAVEVVEVAFAGTTTRLGLEPETGRILTASHRGRGPRLWFGERTRVWSEHRAVGGLVLPHAEATWFDGEEVRASEALAVRVDDERDAGAFARPAR